MVTTPINKNSLGSSNFLTYPEDPVLAGLRSAEEAEHGPPGARAVGHLGSWVPSGNWRKSQILSPAKHVVLHETWGFSQITESHRLVFRRGREVKLKSEGPVRPMRGPHLCRSYPVPQCANDRNAQMTGELCAQKTSFTHTANEPVGYTF